jgi:3-methyladenine DNA glycosylase AlkD
MISALERNVKQMNQANEWIVKRLFEMQDTGYQQFQSKLIPTISPDLVIGVRMPDLRKFAQQLSKMPEAETFLSDLPHRYYEENNLHGALIARMRDYDRVIEEIDRFLPYIDNWATCDMLSPKVFARHRDELIQKIPSWIHAEHPYTVRFGIGMLMQFYLDEWFDVKYCDWVAEIRSDEYYVKMMVAWYFATALAKQYQVVLPYLENHRLEQWTHNKAIQKAMESNRIMPEQKVYLKTLKEKKTLFSE